MLSTRWRGARCIALAVLFVCLLVPGIALAAAKPTAGTIKGAVTGFDAAKLKDVRVVAYVMTTTPGQDGITPVEVASTRTDKRGVYALTLAPGTYRVGFLPTNVARYAWEYFPGVSAATFGEDLTLAARGRITGIDAQLEAAGRISGTIVDELGVPVSGTRVNLQLSWGMRPETVMSATTGVDGAFDFNGLPVDDFGVEVSDPLGWHVANTDTWLNLAMPGQQISGVVIEMARAGKLAGSVVDESGDAIAGITVVPYLLQSEGMGGGSWEPRWDQYAETAGDGTYTLVGLPAGIYAIRFTDERPTGRYAQEFYSDAVAPGAADQVTVLVGATHEGIDEALTVGGSVSGTVMTPDGPYTGWGVFFAAWVGDHWEDVGGVACDESGHYSARLTYGRYRVFFGTQDWNYVWEYWSNTLQPDLATPVDLTAEEPDAVGVDAMLARPSHITGRVTDELTGEPLANISVGVGQQMGPDPEYWDQMSWANTDENGYYDVPVSMGTFRVQFWDDSGVYAGEAYDNVVGRTDPGAGDDITVADEEQVVSGIDAALVRAGHIKGRVTDANGDPVAGIGVAAGLKPEVWNHVTWTETEDDGTYDLPVAPGTYGVNFIDWNGLGYLEEWYDDVTDGELAQSIPVAAGEEVAGIDAVLATPAFIRGRVTNDAGNGIAAINVEAHLKSDNPEEYPPFVGGADTDDQGFYEIPVPPGLDVIVQFSDQGANAYLGEWYDDVGEDWQQATLVSATLESPAENIDAVLAEGAHIRGRVTNADGVGIQDIDVSAEVLAENPDEGTWWMGGSGTDENGYYDMLVAPGEYLVHFGDWQNNTYLDQWYDGIGGRDWQNATPVTVSFESPAENIDAVLERGAHVRGRVTDQAGNGLSDIGVNAHVPDVLPEQGPAFLGNTGTDENGYYDVLVPAGTCIIHFEDWSGQGYLGEWFDDAGEDYADATPVATSVDTPAEGVNAALEQGAHIRGRVTDAAGAPIVGIGVAINIPPTEGEEMQPGIGGAETDENGDYDAVVPAGTYLVMFGPWNNDGYLMEWFDDVWGWGEATPVTTTADNPAIGINATLERASYIEGRVTNSAGSGVGGVQVSVAVLAEDGWMMDFKGGAQTDGDGYYRAPVDAGTYRVGFTPPDTTALSPEWFNDQLVGQNGTPVVVEQGATVEAVNAVLSVPGTITGRVTDSVGNPVVGLQVVNAVEVGTGQWSWLNQAHTDGNGVYTLYCHPGQVLVGFVDQSGYWAERWYPDAGWPGGGALQTVTEGGSVTGVDMVMVPNTP